MAGVEAQLSLRRGREAISFYKEAFGAVEVFRFGGRAGHEEVVARLEVLGGRFWVEDEAPPHHFSPESLGGATGRMLLAVDRPHAWLRRALAAGATELTPVHEEHGWLLGRVVDPFGHHWEIGRSLAEDHHGSGAS